MLERAYVEYHADRFTDASLVVRDGAKIVALLPASRHGDDVSSHGGLTFGGLVLGRSSGVAAAMRSMYAAIEALRASGARTLRYKPMPHIYHDLPAEDDLYAVFRAGGRLVRRDIAVSIPATGGGKYTKGRKHSLKRARQLGIEVGSSTDIAGFMQIEAEVLDRHGAVATHTTRELELLAARFPEAIRLTVATLGGVMLAGVVTYETSKVVHAQYIGSSAQGKQSGAADIILDALVERAAASGRWFDFGTSNERAGWHLNVGLVRNKESYGARGIAYDQYDIDLTDLPGDWGSGVWVGEVDPL